MSFRPVLLLLILSSAAHATTIEARNQAGPNHETLCIDVAGWSTAAGTDLIVYPCHGGANQRFTFDRARGELRSALGDFCVDVSKGAAVAGNRVQLWPCNGSAAQRFHYDRAQGTLRFAGLCVSGGPTLRLTDCARATRFDVTTAYGDRRFDELTFLTAHNAFANYEDSRWAAPNQSRGMIHALDDGVRALMLDVHSFESSTARCIFSFGSDCYGRDLYFCHEDCNGVPGVGYALPRQPVADAFTRIVDWLNRHPDEIVTLFLEDYSSHDELQRVLGRVPGLYDVLIDAYAWNEWPLARDLIDANRRLLIISDHPGRSDLGVVFGPDLTVENYWSMGPWGTDVACHPRWSSVPLDAPGLFVMNHFRDAATVIGSAIDNARGALISRLDDQCLPLTHRKPNYLAVDFYELGSARAVAAEIDQSRAILFSDAGYGGRAQLLGDGVYRLSELSIGNDKVSSLTVAPGAFVTLYEHDNFAGRSVTQSSSASFVGASFNDLASSVVVGEWQ